ncbi:hypothetical protein acsn021_33810 [Anaerocolumna cellulosilytica]|uniref:Uncharacterized protein n=1 Tax=Anaerocolumna cellulosilytica TaxID=433286 RepID=A0A6S6R977_9FIRM|nr:AraC family transcriptional regulator [Anaerocolumna cellulosilytica]MBB5196794.1 AraC-like DNA-binding protein [Anaerocolumna cellulosilytica]BCJ95812.1 hypothetical protein acsn021_33810 [Anaerocolumna cellulosilytica]
MPKKMYKENNYAITIDKVQNIIDYLEEQLLELLTPDTIAKQFYMSVSTLNNLFRIVCNMTIMEYVRNRRLSLAGLELKGSDIHIIDLALKYGYETPEAFTKAFTRFHGFPPSFVRRAYPNIKVFHSLQINIQIQGGWYNIETENIMSKLTDLNSSEQEENLLTCYNEIYKVKGGLTMENVRCQYCIHVEDMQQKEDWYILLSLADKLNQSKIKFKVDGKTMIFAHGLEFKLEKICLTFKWNEEQIIQDFFGYNKKAIECFKGFKYFDVIFEGMKVRCMFYGDCPGDDTDDFLYRNTEPVEVDGKILPVQKLEFYYANTEPKDQYYKMVEQWLKR